MIEDISERKATEQALLDSRALLVDAQKMAQLGSWEIDYEKDIVTWSDEIYRMTGLGPDDYDGVPNSYLQYVHPEDRERVARRAGE